MDITKTIRSGRFLISLLLLILAVLSSCKAKPTHLVIGVSISADQVPAVQLAARDINQSGGIGGIPIELAGINSLDKSLYDPKALVAQAREFSSNPFLVAVIGQGDSASTLSAAAFYNQYHIPQIVTIATNPAITSIGDWTYRLCISDAIQAPALAEYAVQDWGQKNIVIFYVNDDYGRGLAELFQKRAEQLGAHVLYNVMHHNNLDQDDRSLIRSILSKLKKSSPPPLFVLFQRTAAAQWTIGTIHELGVKGAILGSDNLGSNDFLSSPPSLTEGLRFSQFFRVRPDLARSEAFVTHYRMMTNSTPDYGHAYAYDAMFLVRDAVLWGGFSREGVKSYLDHLIRSHTPTEGVAGSYRLSSDHDARRPLDIVEIRGGQQILVKSVLVP